MALEVRESGGVLESVGQFAKRVGWFLLGTAAVIAVAGGVSAEVIDVCEV